MLARSDADKLAFAVHAFLLAEGYKLVAAGPAAEDEGAGERPDLGFVCWIRIRCLEKQPITVADCTCWVHDQLSKSPVRPFALACQPCLTDPRY